MPLPDANKRSPRVYTNLQNLDLDNVTFANVQSTGNPINVEEVNEDELRRLVLVNLARLVCAGEWNGLLTAGGGGAGFVEMLPQAASTGADQYDITNTPPWAGTVNTNSNMSWAKKPHAFPFISPVTGTVSEIGISIATAEAGDSMYVGIYSQDDDFLTETLLGYATIALDSTGIVYQSSISATVELTAGTQYWFSVNSDQSTSAALTCADEQYLPCFGMTASLTAEQHSISDDSVDLYAVPPSTFTPNKLEDEDRPLIGLKF